MTALALSLIWFVVKTWRWPLIGDASLMHYVAFLLDRGLAPYRDIWDINLPGAYLPDWFFQHFFGPAALPWRIFDLALLATTGAAMMFIARPRAAFAAFWAASLFALVHGRDGMEQLGQRDLTASVLLVLAVAFLFAARRTGRSALALAFGILAAAATTVKPGLVLFLLLPAIDLACTPGAKLQAKRRLAASAAGSLLPFCLVLAWLYREGSLHAFWFTASVLIPYHASLARIGWLTLLYKAASPLLPFFLAWLLLRAAQASRATREFGERSLLVLSAAFGLVSFLAQAKGYPYQRYPFLVFALLVVGCDFTAALDAPSPFIAWFSACTLLGASLIVAPSSAFKAGRYGNPVAEFQTLLTSGLRQIAPGRSPASLSGKVLCLDSISGCVNTLEDLQIVQSSPNLYDEFLFQPGNSKAVAMMRKRFAESVQRHPPGVLVVASPLFPSGPNDYRKLACWPEFNTWLNQNYILRKEEQPAAPVRSMGRSSVPPGLRLYVHR